MFTDKLIKSEKPTTSVRRVWESSGDPLLKGFGLVIAPSGAKSFCIYYSSPENNKRRMYNLGKYPSVSLAESREMCRQARRLIDRGIDPIEENGRKEIAREKKLAIEANRGSVEQLFEFYIQDLSNKGKRSASEVSKIYKHDIGSYIGSLPTSEITKDHCSDIIARVAGRGALIQANRVRSYLLAAFNFGLVCNDLPQWRGKTPDFSLLYNPASQTQKAISKERPGTRYLQPVEIVRLWNSIGVDFMHRDLAVAIKMILATGQRVEEVLHAEWSEFELDVDDGIWRIPSNRRKTKDKVMEDHIVPLTDFHLSIIKPLDRQTKWLFPNINGDQPRKNDALNQAVSRFCQSVKFDKFTPRDIRRTWKTQSGRIGLSLEIRNRIQGHAFQDIGSKSYDQYDYLDQKREAMNRWSKWLETTVNPPIN